MNVCFKLDHWTSALYSGSTINIVKVKHHLARHSTASRCHSEPSQWSCLDCHYTGYVTLLVSADTVEVMKTFVNLHKLKTIRALLNSAVLKQAKSISRTAPISRWFARKTRARKGKGPDTFLPPLRETGGRRPSERWKDGGESKGGGGRNTVEIEQTLWITA